MCCRKVVVSVHKNRTTILVYLNLYDMNLTALTRLKIATSLYRWDYLIMFSAGRLAISDGFSTTV
ncbi:hypothetical protein PANT111_30005 [Pantoea brenneri]|uniref:Uncharacterized protein n=1 Tax=Pantoea brenneri TaxID=472694 RepID=A0AAX3J9D6_9GAMM|nr:hypothetical protein PANT111_30005 [Pantoea brenneri]